MQREDEKEAELRAGARQAIVMALTTGAYTCQANANALNKHWNCVMTWGWPLGPPVQYFFTQTGFGSGQLVKHPKHPLQDFALAAFDSFGAQDASSLAEWLARGVTDGSDRTVAEDLLGVLTRQGLVEKDEHGWYRRVRKP
jgi:hypothetical protein